jgi:uncharacterized protein
MIFDTNAWLGVWPFRALRDNSPDTLVARLDRAGVDMAAVSQIEAMFHRNPQPANEKLALSVEAVRDRLVPVATINPLFPKWEKDLAVCLNTLDMKAVRVVPQYHNYPVDGAEMREVVTACGEYGVPVLIAHRIEDVRQHHWMDPGRVIDLNLIAQLISDVPKTNIIIQNARPINDSPVWLNTNIRDGSWYFDLSLAEVHYGLHRTIDRMSDLSEFVANGGSNHLVFGSHVPISYIGPALVKRATLPVDTATLDDISWSRAASMFGIS